MGKAEASKKSRKRRLAALDSLFAKPGKKSRAELSASERPSASGEKPAAVTTSTRQKLGPEETRRCGAAAENRENYKRPPRDRSTGAYSDSSAAAAPSAPRPRPDPATEPVYASLDLSNLHAEAEKALQWPASQSTGGGAQPIASRLAAVLGSRPAAATAISATPSTPLPSGFAGPEDPPLLRARSAGRGWRYAACVLETALASSMDVPAARKELRSRLEDRHLLLDNPVAALGGGRGRKRRDRGVAASLMSRRQLKARGLIGGPVGQGIARELHDRWVGYARQALARRRPGSSVAQAVNSMSLVGCLMRVTEARDPRIVGTVGTVVDETQTTWHVAAWPGAPVPVESATANVRAIPKKGTQVAFEVPLHGAVCARVTLLGDGMVGRLIPP